MKNLFLVSLFFVSFSAFATEEIQSPKICYTHGQCQTELPEYGYKCFIVKTGTYSDGSASCVMRCPTMPIGSYCEMVPGKIWGVCKKEVFTMPKFDPADCSSAIDPDEL